MSIKPLIILPDPVLRQLSKPVERFDDQLRKFAGDISAALLASGRAGDEPAAIVTNAARPDQTVIVTSLAALPQQAALAGDGPSILVVGLNVALARELMWTRD